MTTPLGELLLARVSVMGPMTVAEYMHECLLHPDHGYYTGETVFGAAGDFTTAPEISQMFGELVGLALAQAWMDQGAPARAVLLEMGPGRGTLMADILRVLDRVPGAQAALRPHLLEASPRLRRRQAEALAGHDPVWIDRLADLPDAPVFAVANEFFDALPIRQFQRAGDAWSERMLIARDGALAFGQAPPTPFATLADRLADTRDGDLVEISQGAPAIMTDLSGRIVARGGAALVIDYGDWRSRGDTLQAVKAHEFDDVLAHPGQADLTAHVDFEPLARAAQAAGATVTALTPQGDWLTRLGLAQRAEALARALRGDALASHLAAARRLTDPQDMGHLFKVLGLHAPGTPPLPGLGDAKDDA